MRKPPYDLAAGKRVEQGSKRQSGMTSASAPGFRSSSWFSSCPDSFNDEQYSGFIWPMLPFKTLGMQYINILEMKKDRQNLLLS